MVTKCFAALNFSVALGLAAWACATHRYVVDTYACSLRLVATPNASRGRKGDTIVVKHLLTNVSDHVVEGCVTEAKGYTFFLVGGEALGHAHAVGHVPCVRRFRLRP